jgi:hypothetical protein
MGQENDRDTVIVTLRRGDLMWRWEGSSHGLWAVTGLRHCCGRLLLNAGARMLGFPRQPKRVPVSAPPERWSVVQQNEMIGVLQRLWDAARWEHERERGVEPSMSEWSEYVAAVNEAEALLKRLW